MIGTMPQFRLTTASRPLTEDWQRQPVPPPGPVRLGLSFRPLQAEALGLDPAAALTELLAYPFPLIRLAAYWDRIETEAGRFRFDELDRQLDAAQAAGKEIIVCVGAVKAFGYPEFFVPGRYLDPPLREGSLVTPQTHAGLAEAAAGFVARVVQRYRDRPAVVAWQVEHEAVDPLGVEHSWRLARAFAAREVAAVRAADPGRPVLMNGFLATSAPVAWQQRWRTRDQGDSLAVATELADIVGVDYYPRHAVAAAGPLTLYLDGSTTRRQRRSQDRLLGQVAAAGRRLIIAEGQAEPWEAVTTPPSPAGRVMYSCGPGDVIATYARARQWAGHGPVPLEAYLFWGAEYWLARERGGDPSYLRAFERILRA
jgi:Beta-galactosidase